jgi:uncharacterized membrane protein YtjA (UPF0391 family)
MFGWAVLLLWSLALLVIAMSARLQGFDGIASPTFFMAQLFFLIAVGGLAYQIVIRLFGRHRTPGKL